MERLKKNGDKHLFQKSSLNISLANFFILILFCLILACSILAQVNAPDQYKITALKVSSDSIKVAGIINEDEWKKKEEFFVDGAESGQRDLN